MQSLTFTRPDDCHVHLRDDAALTVTVPHIAHQFARAIIMPNLVKPVTTVEQALAYRQRILQYVPAGLRFDPLMTLYLTEETTEADVKAVAETPEVIGFKLYPAGATTNAQFGVNHIRAIYPIIAVMEALAVPLLVHGESIDPEVDVFDREQKFIEQTLQPLLLRFPQLRIVFEHITTQDAVSFVTDSQDNVGATITAHHLLLNRNALFKNGIRPHHYCLPVLKRREHQEALIKAATSGNPKFFLGTDSAPHARSKKESACGCAGIYTAHAALELYAEAFEKMNKLSRLEAFASRYGAQFYGLPFNKDTITLNQNSWQVPDFYNYLGEQLIPFQQGETLRWQITASETTPSHS